MEYSALAAKHLSLVRPRAVTHDALSHAVSYLRSVLYCDASNPAVSEPLALADKETSTIQVPHTPHAAQHTHTHTHTARYVMQPQHSQPVGLLVSSPNSFSSAGRAPCLSINLPHDATGPCPSPTVPGPLSHLSCGLGFPARSPLHALTRAATFTLTNAKGRYGPIQQPPWWLPCQPEASRQLHEYPFRGSF